MSRTYKRSTVEWIFLVCFFPAIFFMYIFYKYPTLFVEESMVKESFYLLGKSTSFWYGLVYTTIVCSIAGYTFWKNKSPYKKGTKKGDLFKISKR